MSNWLLDEMRETKGVKSDNWLLDEMRKKTDEDTEYNAFRSATTGFIESAIGAGDELDATIRLLSGEAQDWSQAIGQSRAELKAFEDANPNASMVINTMGLGAGLFIPGAGIAKIAQAGTKLDRALKVGGLGAAEGAVYGFLSGEGEDRVTSAGIGAVAGGALGGLSGAYLTKNTDEIKEATRLLDAQTYKGKGSYIGGEEGFRNVGRAKESSRPGVTYDTSTASRQVQDIKDDAIIVEQPAGESGTVGSVFLSTKDWIAKNVGVRAARLAEDAEIMTRHDQREIDEIFDTEFLTASELFDNNKGLKSLALRMNKSIKEDRRVSWEDFTAAAKSPEEKAIVRKLEEQVKTLQELDFVKQGDIDYFPTKAIDKIGTKEARPDAYDNPVMALKEYAEDVSASRALAARFDIDTKDLRPPKSDIGESRLNVVIEAIEKEAKKQGASTEVAANLGNGLRSQFVASKKGGNTVGAVARRVTSASLLANPMNAILNIAEGVTAPIYQNGVKAWMKTVPRAVLSTLNSELGVRNKGWISNKELGLDKDFMGEIANAGKKAMDDSADAASLTKLFQKAVPGIDVLNKTLYKYSGVQTVNRMGQELLSNSAVQRGMDLANDGSEKALAKLRKHDGMRGLTESEFKSTVRALKDKDLSNPYIINFAGAALNKWQPVSASTMPKAFHDNPNGRMAYSMLSYMNKQMNSLRNDVGLNILRAQEKGLNSKEGAEAIKLAMLNSAKYAGIFGVVAGVWDDYRKTLDLTNDKTLEKLLTPEGVSSALMNQLASNMSSGILNIRAEEYGGQPVEPIPAPISAGFRLGSGLFTAGERVYTGADEPLTPLLRAGQTYLPGLANIDRVMRMTVGERLLTDD
jgi:hypothetical protein